MQSGINFEGSSLSPSLSNHHRIFISSSSQPMVKAPFKCFNAWAKERFFFKIVKTTVTSSPLFIAVRKLSSVMAALKSWRKYLASIEDRIKATRLCLESS